MPLPGPPGNGTLAIPRQCPHDVSTTVAVSDANACRIVRRTSRHDLTSAVQSVRAGVPSATAAVAGTTAVAAGCSRRRHSAVRPCSALAAAVRYWARPGVQPTTRQSTSSPWPAGRGPLACQARQSIPVRSCDVTMVYPARRFPGQWCPCSPAAAASAARSRRRSWATCQ